MKLFWKLFICVETILMIIFAVFGLVLMHYSFENALDREMEQSSDDLKIFKYSLLTSMENLPDTYYAGDTAIEQMAEVLRNNMAGSGDIVKVYNQNMETVYASDTYESSLAEDMPGQYDGISAMIQHGDSYFLELLTRIDSKIGTYYLEIDRDISYAYVDRNNLINNYKIALLGVFIISLFVIVMISLAFTRPIKQLSRETRHIAKGNYKHRITVKGNDEITELMLSFNGMSDELEKNIEKLKEDARRQEDFSAAFAHELKTPLTSVIGYAEMMRSRKMSVKDVNVCSDYIYQQGKRLERLAYKLMELVGMREGTLVMREIKVVQLVDRIKQTTFEMLKEKSISLDVDVEKGIIYGDIDLILSLFLNLTDNARKACGEGGNIKISGRQKENGYEIEVLDNGGGIPEDEIHKITEAFYMVDKSRARKEGGAGIGMALCQKIIELHGAEWDITSKLGEGTKVSVLFKGKHEE